MRRGSQNMMGSDEGLPEYTSAGHPAFVQRFENFLKTIALTLKSKKYFLLILFCVLYFSIVFWLALHKIFWNDELFTLQFARLPVWPDLWEALGTGADQIPPTFVLITKLSVSLFGENHVSLRLPQIVGFLGMCLCLYGIVSKRTEPVYGFVAMFLPLLTGAFGYAYEARGYGLLLGFSALAFYCWCSLEKDKGKALCLIGLCFSVAGAMMSHYYGVLVLFPLGVGEIVRTFALRKVHIPVWIALILSLFPLLLFLPFIQASLSRAPSFWGKTSWYQIFSSYNNLLYSLSPIAALLCVISPLTMRFPCVRESGPPSAFRSYELVAAAGFVAIPIVAVILTKLVVGTYSERYGVIAIVGFSTLIPLAICRFVPKSIASLTLICLLIGFIARSTIDLQTWKGEAESMKQQFHFLQINAKDGIPIVFSQSILRIHYYAPKDLSNRVIYLADPKASIRYLGHDTMDWAFLELRPWFPLKNVRPYDLFIQSEKEFFLYHLNWEEESKWTWLFYPLLENRMTMELIVREGDQFLFLIRRDGHSK